MKGDLACLPYWVGINKDQLSSQAAPRRQASSWQRGALEQLSCLAAVWGTLCSSHMLLGHPRMPDEPRSRCVMWSLGRVFP